MGSPIDLSAGLRWRCGRVQPVPAACGNDSDNGLSRFAGRPLEIDAEIYASQAATNLRNRGIAKLLEGYGRMYFDALEATDVYTRQCSLKVARRRLKDARRSQRT